MKYAKLAPVVLGIVLGMSTTACSIPEPAPTPPPTTPAATTGMITPRPDGTTDLSDGLKAQNVAVAPVDDAFTTAIADYSVNLFRQVATGQDNYLTSPLSAELALAMTANGAGGETLAQMVRTIAPGLTLDQINAILPAYVNNLPSTDAAKFHLANSIWYNSGTGVNIQRDFLQTNANTYQAGTYASPFDDTGRQAINAWVKDNTDGMIPSMLDKLEPTSAVVLLNALAFDAQWAEQYGDSSIHDGKFTDATGKQTTAKFMSSKEYGYLDDGLATGFTKPYENGQYEFVALLPNAGVSMADYLASLTADRWIKTLQSGTGPVYANLPQFSFDYSASLKDPLKAMGMTDAFDASAADFAAMGTSNKQPLYVDDVIQKTYIEVTPVGTRAGAGTAVVMGPGAAPGVPPTVTLDRPFIFGIVDSATQLPLFLGVLNQI